MDLFSYREEENNGQSVLLADRMRPNQLDDFIGQEHIVGPGKLLRRAIEQDQIRSIILYGPPGTGKTTLAHIISQQTKGAFIKLNAVSASVKDVRETIEQARELQTLYGKRTILFLDEVHRFNRAQQDALLPAVESGLLTLIGATTENPYHHVNGALLSRSTLFQFEALTIEHAVKAMRKALEDEEKGLGFLQVHVDEEAIQHIARMANGDIRKSLNALEFAAMSALPDASGNLLVDLEAAAESIRKPTIQADESVQYDVLSAFHKSIRGSSDAALFWFMYAVEKLGMDPMIFLRRLIVASSEDIGLANPQALVQSVTAMDAYDKIGWPEAKYPIAQAILFAVESPKSNAATVALGRVGAALDRLQSVEVPLHLRDTHYKGSAELGHVGYKYPHDYPHHYITQQYVPDSLLGETFYEASEQGMEEKIGLNQRKRRQQGQK